MFKLMILFVFYLDAVGILGMLNRIKQLFAVTFSNFTHLLTL